MLCNESSEFPLVSPTVCLMLLGCCAVVSAQQFAQSVPAHGQRALRKREVKLPVREQHLTTA